MNRIKGPGIGTLEKAFLSSIFFSRQNSFYVEHIILIIRLITTSFLSIYERIVKLLAWHRKIKKRKALKKGK